MECVSLPSLAEIAFGDKFHTVEVPPLKYHVHALKKLIFRGEESCGPGNLRFLSLGYYSSVHVYVSFLHVYVCMYVCTLE